MPEARRILGGETIAKVVAGDGRFGAERIIGDTVDYLPASFLVVGQTAASAVARVIQRDGQPVGSGFLISRSLFLTNNHVIGSQDEAKGMLLEFDYQTDRWGQPLPTTRFEIDDAVSSKPETRTTSTSPSWRSVRLQGAKTIADFGFCPLSDRGDKHQLGEFVNLVEHPEGNYKQLVLRENKLVSRLETVLHYEADTQPGSSGSPVLNDEWEAIALHHWGEPHRERRTADGQPVPTSVNEGIRISAIVKVLEGLRPELSPPRKALLDDALKADVPKSGESRPTPIPPAPSTPVKVQPTANAATLASAKSGGLRVNRDGSVTLSLEIDVRVGGGLDVGRDEKLAPAPRLLQPFGLQPRLSRRLLAADARSHQPGVRCQGATPAPDDGDRLVRTQV